MSTETMILIPALVFVIITTVITVVHAFIAERNQAKILHNQKVLEHYLIQLESRARVEEVKNEMV